MDYLNTFKRYEIKYILTSSERNDLCRLMDGRMKIDRYGHTTIRNIYYDTDNYRIIRFQGQALFHQVHGILQALITAVFSHCVIADGLMSSITGSGIR